MEYRNFGRTGVKVSALCLGTMNFGFRTEEQESKEIVHAALDMGINFIDTANAYSRGTSETYIGKALAESGKRDKVFLATKVWANMDDNDINGRWATRRHIMEQIEGSLKRLGTDYVDLYQIHRPLSEYPQDETLRALDDLVHSGKVRYIGVSTFPAWQMVESLWIAKEYGLNRYVSEQPPYNLLDRTVEREVLPMAKAYGFAILPWSPLASGRLSGTYRRGKDAPEDSRLMHILKQQENATLADYIKPEAYDVIELVAEMAAEKGVSMTQLALGWVAQRDGVTSPIIGPRTVKQLQTSQQSLEISFTEEDQSRIDAVIPPGTAINNYYRDTDFGTNLYRW